MENGAVCKKAASLMLAAVLTLSGSLVNIYAEEDVLSAPDALSILTLSEGEAIEPGANFTISREPVSGVDYYTGSVDEAAGREVNLWKLSA